MSSWIQVKRRGGACPSRQSPVLSQQKGPAKSYQLRICRTFLLVWPLYRRTGPLSAFGHFPQRGKQGLPGHQPLRREGEWRALREAPPTGCPELRHTVGADSIRPPCGSLSEALGLSRRPAAVTEGVQLLPSDVSREIDGRHLPQRGRLWASSRGRDPLSTSKAWNVARSHDNGDLIRRFAPPSPCAGKA